MEGLTGKIALVTGAGGMGSLGRVTALKLARQGADVAVTDRRREPDTFTEAEVEGEWRGIDSVAEEVRAVGTRCLPVYCDLGYGEQIQDMVNRVMKEFGKIDILVNNARAVSTRDKVPVTELPLDAWDHTLAINTTAVMLCTKMVAREMVRAGNGGRIINISSKSAKQATALGAAYCASKFAVLGLTQASALDLAPYGITVNAVCPGSIHTDRYTAARLSEGEKAKARELNITLDGFAANLVEEQGRATPLGHIADPEDIANMVAFIASEEAGFITGQAYNVNGGELFH